MCHMVGYVVCHTIMLRTVGSGESIPLFDISRSADIMEGVAVQTWFPTFITSKALHSRENEISATTVHKELSTNISRSVRFMTPRHVKDHVTWMGLCHCPG